MTDTEALEAVTPCMKRAWRGAASLLKVGMAAEAFNAVNTAAAALFLMGYDLGRAEAVAHGEQDA